MRAVYRNRAVPRSVLRLGAFFAWLVSGSLLAADAVAPAAISSKELAVLRVVRAKLCESNCGVDALTMPAGYLDAEMLLGAGIVPAPEGLLEDFRARNAEPQALPSDFQEAGPAGLLPAPGERRRCMLSRPGFDQSGTQALVLVKRVFIYPEDIMNEGLLVLLSWKEGAWSVEKSGKAWDMRLGK